MLNKYRRLHVLYISEFCVESHIFDNNSIDLSEKLRLGAPIKASGRGRRGRHLRHLRSSPANGGASIK